jgi:ABC-2 type transport system permease protein
MTPRPPDAALLPNAALVARREFLERVRSRAFAVATLILAVVAVGLTFIPIIVRAADRETTVRIAVVADDPALAGRTIELLDGFLNQPPQGADPATFTRRYRFSRESSADAGAAAMAAARVDALLMVGRTSAGGLAFAYRTSESALSSRSQVLQVVTFAIALFDWQAEYGTRPGVPPFQLPTFTVQSSAASAGGSPLDSQETASRSILATILIVLIFITLTIYGMWVATSVASEKSSRVMELLISTATPRQLLVGKVVGVGAAGLTQYLAIVLPAAGALLLQDRIAAFFLGAGTDASVPLAGPNPAILLAFGVLFLLGFLLYAFIYAAAGSLVSRPEDIQQLALPLSFLSMAGYFSAVFGLASIGSPVVAVLSYVPFFSPFVMLARLSLGHVQPWELALSLGLLVAAIGVAMLVATRIYAAGVLLYGQRPGLRAFVRAAITGGNG